MKKNKGFVAILIKTLKYGFKLTPKYFMFFLIISLILAVFNILTIDYINKFFNIINDNSNSNITNLMLYGVILFCGFYIIDSLYQVIKNNYFNDFIGRILEDLNAKAARLQTIEFESDYLYKKIGLAINGVRQAIDSTIQFISAFVLYLFFFIGLCFYLFELTPFSPILVIIIIFPKILSQILKAKKLSIVVNDSIQNKREMEYYQRMFSSMDAFKDIRLLNLNNFMLEKSIVQIKQFCSKEYIARRKFLRKELILETLVFLSYLFGIIYLVMLFKTGNLLFGSFTALYYSLNKVIDNGNEMVELFGNILLNANIAGNLYEYLEMPEVKNNKEFIDDDFDIKLKNVNFVFPQREEYALKNINLTLKKGITLAIIGRNGSGKSTLAKVLFGLYKPSSGEVLYNEQDISLYDKTVNKKLSAVFQDFVKYKLTLKDNITISDLNKPIDNKLLNQLVKEFGIKSMDSEMILSQGFGGIELSGGEWQRIAIARSAYKNHEALLMDEPTSAIDPIEESEIYNKIGQLSKKTTTVIITHRLGSLKFADRIIVLDRGEIIEDGTPEELYNAQGVYYKMRTCQSNWYDNGEE